MSGRAKFVFGLAVGAWLNIWTAVAGVWGPFVLAYVLVFASIAVTTFERQGDRHD